MTPSCHPVKICLHTTSSSQVVSMVTGTLSSSSLASPQGKEKECLPDTLCDTVSGLRTQGTQEPVSEVSSRLWAMLLREQGRRLTVPSQQTSRAQYPFPQRSCFVSWSFRWPKPKWTAPQDIPKALLTAWCPSSMETRWLAQGHTLKSLSHKQGVLTLAYP